MPLSLKNRRDLSRRVFLAAAPGRPAGCQCVFQDVPARCFFGGADEGDQMRLSLAFTNCCNPMPQRWLHNTRIIHWQWRQEEAPLQPGAGVYAYASGREALLALLVGQGWPPGAKVLAPAYLPEGVYAPLRHYGCELVFYNLDQQGHPAWAEVTALAAAHQPRLAILIHLYGVPRAAHRFRALLPASTLLLEDWAQGYPGLAPPAVGDWLLYSANKQLGLPDGAWLVHTGGGQPPAPPQPGPPGQRWAYLALRWAYLALATLRHYLPWLDVAHVLQRLIARSYLASYRLLQRHSAHPHPPSASGLWAWRHSPHRRLIATRLAQAARYQAGLRATPLASPMWAGPVPPYPLIGWPLWVENRRDFHHYLYAHGVQGVMYTDAWWGAPAEAETHLAASRALWNCHYLLPINPALSIADIDRIVGLVNAWSGRGE